MILYGNGQLLQIGKPGHYMEEMGAENVGIGGAFNTQTFVHACHGVIDEVKWWSVARSAQEICEGLGGFSSGATGRAGHRRLRTASL